MYKTLKEVWKNLEVKEREYLKAGLKLIILLGIVSIIILPWLLTRKLISFINYNQTGAIGDTINGIAGPFIALIAAVLTFLAFYIQYKANLQQKEQFISSLEKQKHEAKEQEKTWKIERFENRFYELLKLHRENVGEFNIADRIHGRKCFVPMFYELRYCYRLVKDFYKNANEDIKQEQEYDKMNIMSLSYRANASKIGRGSVKSGHLR